MLTIRASQREILAHESFERKLLEHVRHFFAARCDAVGPAESLAFLREAVDRGRAHGLPEGPALSSYVDLVFTFGPDFEQAPWARELVAGAGPQWSEFTVDALFEAAIRELDPEAPLGVEDEEDFQLVEPDDDESDDVDLEVGPEYEDIEEDEEEEDEEDEDDEEVDWDDGTDDDDWDDEPSDDPEVDVTGRDR